jgi:hypothetical protein
MRGQSQSPLSWSMMEDSAANTAAASAGSVRDF